MKSLRSSPSSSSALRRNALPASGLTDMGALPWGTSIRTPVAPLWVLVFWTLSAGPRLRPSRFTSSSDDSSPPEEGPLPCSVVAALLMTFTLPSLKGSPGTAARATVATPRIRARDTPYSDGEHGSPADPDRFVHCRLHLIRSFLVNRCSFTPSMRKPSRRPPAPR